MRWIIIGKDDINSTPGGLNRYVRGLVDGMRQSEMNVTLMMAGDTVSQDSDKVVIGNTLQKVCRFFIEGYKSVGKYDVINTHFALYGAPYLAGVQLSLFLNHFSVRRKFLRRPTVICHFHGPWAEESRVAKVGTSASITIKKLMEAYSLSRAAKVLVLSSEFRSEVQRQFGIPGGKVATIQPGVDRQWFNLAAPPGVVESHTLALVCVRRLTPRMGHIALLDQLEALDWRVQGKSISLHIVGLGPEKTHINSWRDRHGRSKEVKMHGYLSDKELRSLMSACDMAVVPTMQLEGFGLVVLEAMAQQLPVISTGQGGLSQAMGPWGTAPYIFSLQDKNSLSEAISAAAVIRESSAQREALSGYASSFSWNDVARRIAELARELEAP